MMHNSHFLTGGTYTIFRIYKFLRLVVRAVKCGRGSHAYMDPLRGGVCSMRFSGLMSADVRRKSGWGWS